MENVVCDPIAVIIGNPPYNAKQLDENDNNKNRKYDIIDERISQTYAKASLASNKNALSDMYVKFFRWATDRLGNHDGVVCFVTNNSFVDQIAFDGMRKYFLEDFTCIYHVDLHGNVRQNPKLSGSSHNVFGIQVGVGITVAVRSSKHTERRLFYTRVPEFWRKEQKLAWLMEHVELDGRRNSLNTVAWEELNPNKGNTWLISQYTDEYLSFISIGSKKDETQGTLFKTYSRGVATSRDATVYDFVRNDLTKRVKDFIDAYNSEVFRYHRSGGKAVLDDFVDYDKVKWSRDLKFDLKRGNYAEYAEHKVRKVTYRPFCRKYLFFDRVLNEEVYVFPSIYPADKDHGENQTICASGKGAEKAFGAFITNNIPDLNFFGPGSVPQWFPFYVYDEDGGNRRENITDWALQQFQTHYGDPGITKWDIFYYVYGLLHHPGYRSRYADNLKRELPRLPFAPDFRAFANAGKALADLHLHYDSAKPYGLEWVTDGKALPNWRVEKMRLVEAYESPLSNGLERGFRGEAGLPESESAFLAHSEDQETGSEDHDSTPQASPPDLLSNGLERRSYKAYAAVKVNDWLTLLGIPAEAYSYRLGNRSAIEWIVDQYQVKKDERSGIVSDPNDPAHEKYIPELIDKIVRVSVETVRIVAGLPEEFGAGAVANG